jgi:hypothetical protein
VLIGGGTDCPFSFGAPLRFGSDPRPGGGGGFEADGGADAVGERIDPEGGPDDGSGGGTETRPGELEAGPGPTADAETGGARDADGAVGGAGGAEGVAGAEGALLGVDDGAGPGIPMSVFFMSATGGFTTAICGAEAELGGGGGAADVRPVLFLPRPSKMSRSEPLLFSSDIRVS